MDYFLYFVLVSTWNGPAINAAGHEIPNTSVSYTNERVVEFGKANKALCDMAGGFLSEMNVRLDGRPAEVKSFECRYVGDVASRD